ncbi:DUF2268 domain-containing protein [Metabacillus schmidteae]|uniref:DUF2268 domain-containing protein n=1 Tax=Metabacillus schmidteae TaxID=2730405 RepID=UPI00158CA2EF|nr:DUF2268 domain-containing protein [Metabacillus schmidteae]
MSLINTIDWLTKTPQQLEISEKLIPYFNQMNKREIASYLNSFGMYKHTSNINDWIEQMEKKQIVSYVRSLEKKYQHIWNGPDVAIFIFPIDQTNRKIEREYRGRSGLAFHDKLFLFLSKDVLKNDIESLFLHEYHHVCRLATVKKSEETFTIVDNMVMEGLAENAVREIVGEEAVSNWTKLYGLDQCERFYKRIILPHKDIARDHSKFPQLMYGTGFYPNMLGYSVGYHIVKTIMDKTGLKTKQLLGMSSERIMKQYDGIKNTS